MNIYILIFAIVVLVAFVVMIFSSSQALQRFAVIELAVILGFGAMVFFVNLVMSVEYKSTQLDTAKNYFRNNTQIAEYIENGLDSSDDYQNGITLLDGYMLDSIESVDIITEESLVDYGVLDLASNKVSYSGKSDKIRTSLADLVRTAKDGALEMGRGYSIAEDDDNLAFVGVSTATATPKFAVYSIISTEELANYQNQRLTKLITVAAIILAVITGVLALILFLQSRELKGIIKRIKRAASGVESWEVLKTRVPGFFPESDDIRTLRMSLNRLVDDDERNSHKVVEKLKSYCRFAPRHIEKLFEGRGIMGLSAGDSVEVTGIIANVAISLPQSRGEAYKNKVSLRFNQVCKAKNEHDGMLISTTHDLTEMTCLFTGKAENAFDFGMDVTKDTDSFVILHKAPLSCGIVGDDNENQIYVASKEVTILGKYAEKFRTMGLQMVLTDKVCDLVSESVTTRYIGFIEDSGLKYKLYEVLDVYPGNLMKTRSSNNKKFAEAINLFYQDDFYLARNCFSEILKVDPADPIAMWYLFVCEHNLNTSTKDNVSYALFSGEE